MGGEEVSMNITDLYGVKMNEAAQVLSEAIVEAYEAEHVKKRDDDAVIKKIRAELYSVLMDISDLVTGDEKQAYMDGIQDAIETVSRHMEKFRSYDPDIQNSN